MNLPTLSLSEIEPLRAPPTPSKHLKALLESPTKNENEIVNVIRTMVSSEPMLERQTIHFLFSQLVKVGQFKALAVLRSLLRSKGLYTSHMFLYELDLLKNAFRLHEALELHRWWHLKLKKPFLASEAILLLEMHATPRNHLPQRAKKLFYRWIEQGHLNSLGTVGFNALLKVLASTSPSADLDQQLLSILEEMNDIHQKSFQKSTSGGDGAHNTTIIRQDVNLCAPNAATYEIIVSSLDDIKLTNQLYHQALRNGFSTPLLHERYLYRLCTSGKMSEALEWYKKMVKHPVRRRQINAQTLLTILKFCIFTADLAGTQSVFEDAESLGIKPTTAMYAALIDLCARVRNVDMAENILISDLPLHGLEMDGAIYSSLIYLYCEVDNLPKSAVLYKEMRARGYEPLPNTLTPLILKHFEKAKSTNENKWEALGQSFWQDRKAMTTKPTINLLADIFTSSTDLAFLSNLMATILIYLNDNQGLHSLARRIFYKTDALTPERALFIFQRLTLVPELRIEHWMYDHLIKYLAQHKRWDAAFELAQEAVEIAFYFNWYSSKPRQLKWTSMACIDNLSSINYQFHLSATHAAVVYESLVIPNQLDSLADWSLASGAEPYQRWNQATANAWKAQLSSWITDAKRAGLIAVL